MIMMYLNDSAYWFCFTVVIGKSYRGKGFGRVIMEKTEAFAKRYGRRTRTGCWLSLERITS